MTKRRMIHDCLWKSEGLAELTIRQRLLWVGLITTADDQGRGKAHPSLIRSTIFPFDTLTNIEIENDLQAIADEEMVILYIVKGKSYYQILNWWEYQQPQWAYPSEYPAPDGWQNRLRYRHDGRVLTDNWKPDEGKNQTEPLPKALPKALPNTDTLSLTQAHSISISDSSSDSNKQTPLRVFFEELSTAWHNYYPEKRQYGYDTVKAKIAARYKDTGFRENWTEALLKSCNVKALRDEKWFSFEYLIRNNTNYLKLLDGTFAFKDGTQRTDRDPPKLAKPVDADDADAFFRGTR